MTEEEKCKDSPYYFCTKYLIVNGRPFTTLFTQKDFDTIVKSFDNNSNFIFRVNKQRNRF